MRRLPFLLLTVLSVAAIAACSASATPGWTYAPAPSASGAPAASGGASGAPSSAPSSQASVAPSVAASAEASGGAGSPTLTVTAPSGAAGTGFSEKSLEATANTPFTIHFDNQDAQAPHNVAVKGPNGDVALGGDTAFFQGPGTRDYQVPALQPGTYTFYCQVHPSTMNGTLTVK